jgi:cation:H+ antiporter
MNDYVTLSLGIIFAGVGGEIFVRGTVGIAAWARVSPSIIATTIAAFATSSPELSVSINSAISGVPQIALGDSLGSNVVNIALILALALLISGIQSPRGNIKREFPVALLIPIFTAMLFYDNELSRFDGLLLLSLFFTWLFAVILEARKQRSATVEVLGEKRRWLAVLSCVVGLMFLVAAGSLIVTGAKGIAFSFGLDEFIIGATIVALGTSTPELATTVIAKVRGHDEVSLGTILGSNIFNGTFIIGVAATIHPIRVALDDVALTLVFGFMALVFTYPSRTGLISRDRGVLLLMLYSGYLFSILHRQTT